VRVIMRRAVARGVIPANPCAGLELPSGEATPRDRVADPVEAEALIRALESADDRALWATAFYAGLRSGELRALRWEYVDLGANTLAVRENLDDQRVVTAPKTRAGVRVVPVTPRLRRHLAAIRPDTVVPSMYVFPARDGRPFAPTTIRKRALRAWLHAELRPITLHEARHSCISTWIAAGVNIKTASAMAGHASIAITLDRYGHLLPGAADDAMRRVTAYLDAR
jgi:integrase